ncbi:MAG: alpha/beta hydrolase [Defluviitaleaceae bacterium]|nr:alpha/beta hydrolase [Defluviitaleaceae bacterium]
MKCLVRDIPIHYEEYGKGKPILNIHGWGPDHRMMVGAYEPIFKGVKGYRRIYLDLPGFGQTPIEPWVKNTDDMLDIVCEFINAVIGQESFLLTGCSYGGYISLGLLHKMGERVDGVLLDVPMVSCEIDSLPERQIIWQSEFFDSVEKNSVLESYLSMAVIATPKEYEKWQTQIQLGLDARTLGTRSTMDFDYRKDMEEAIGKLTFKKPACILTGRQDHTTGYNLPYKLLERFPRATYAVLDGAGHLLYMEKESLFQKMVEDWIERVELNLSNI